MALQSDQTVIDPETDVEFTAEQHDIWKALFARQQPQVQKFACKEYLEAANPAAVRPYSFGAVAQ
jgi:phenylalanine-4-hydroxylase